MPLGVAQLLPPSQSETVKSLSSSLANSTTTATAVTAAAATAAAAASGNSSSSNAAASRKAARAQGVAKVDDLFADLVAAVDAMTVDAE